MARKAKDPEMRRLEVLWRKEAEAYKPDEHTPQTYDDVLLDIFTQPLMRRPATVGSKGGKQRAALYDDIRDKIVTPLMLSMLRDGETDQSVIRAAKAKIWNIAEAVEESTIDVGKVTLGDTFYEKALRKAKAKLKSEKR